jgi:hypothetical protein
MLAIKPIRNFTLASTLALAALTACVPNKPIFKETNSPYLSEKSIEMLDSFSKENKKVLSDTNYVKCGADTILVQPYLETQFDRFQKTIEQSIQKSVPKSIVDTVESKTFYPTMRQYIKQPKYIYADEYKDIVPVIDNSKFYTKSKFDVYVPVEYYGIPTNNK